MSYQYVTKYDSPNYFSGVKNDVRYIVVHHWGAMGQNFYGVVNWLCNPRSGVSAHYVVQANLVACILNQGQCGWHAGNRWYNQHSIGIECRPECTDADVATLVELIAQIYKDLGRVVPVIGHSDIVATACPGRYKSKLSDIKRRAEAMYASGRDPGVSSSNAASLAVDGVWGFATTVKCQKWLGTPVDGYVSGQSRWMTKYLPNCHSGSWQFSWSPSGSPMVKALQRKLGVAADGIMGPATVKALQRFLGVTVDGICGPATVKALQVYLNRQR